MNFWLVCFLSSIMLVSIADQAFASRHCAPLGMVRDMLMQKFAEAQSHVGSSLQRDAPGSNNYYVLFTNANTRSFSFGVVYGRGNIAGYREGWTCILASGYNWSYRPNKIIIPGVDG